MGILKKYDVKLEFVQGYSREYLSVTKPELVAAGVLKVGTQYINMINIERYFVKKAI